jgi:hypothetical protein
MATLPNWLYEPLPYVYVSTGALATLGMDSIMGVLSGILLMSAGIYIWYLRFEHRGAIKAKQEREAWLREQAEKLKREKQTWLRQEAEKYRKKTDPDDF